MNKKIVILGGGESGVGAAILAKTKGFDVFLSDKAPIKEQYKAELVQTGIDFEENQHSIDAILEANEVVKSPGIPDHVDLIQKIRNANIPVVSEIEFALRYTKANVIGITGTNGKTTTTLLVHHILESAGLNAGLAGNVGHSLARQVARADMPYYVLELSSFQLDGMFDSKLNTAILLNITPDHLDRYDHDFEKYIDSKFRIIRNMEPSDHFIYNNDDPSISVRIKSLETKTQKDPVSLSGKPESSIRIESSYLFLKDDGDEKSIAIEDLPLPGKHNLVNISCAILAARYLDIDWKVIQQALRSFTSVPHRMEFVATVKGRDFYNDSKATNVDAVWYALESFKKPVVLIMGGIDKGNNYDTLDQFAGRTVKSIIALGKDNQKIIDHFSEKVESVLSTESMEEAVQMAYQKSSDTYSILLSPACASFDLFDNYEDRGKKFKEAVSALKESKENNLMLAL